jgi:hypothetical protein
MNDNHELLRRLRHMWRELDPEPPDLVERLLVRLTVRNLDAEILSLLETDQAGIELAAARAGEERLRTVSFGSDSVTVMLTLSASGTGDHRAGGHRVDGWIVPAGALRVEARTARGVRQTVADDTGRFVIDDVPSGMLQLVLHPTEGVSHPLTRPAATGVLHL